MLHGPNAFPQSPAPRDPRPWEHLLILWSVKRIMRRTSCQKAEYTSNPYCASSNHQQPCLVEMATLLVDELAACQSRTFKPVMRGIQLSPVPSHTYPPSVYPAGVSSTPDFSFRKSPCEAQSLCPSLISGAMRKTLGGN